MESPPQNPEFTKNSENFHPWKYGIIKLIDYDCIKDFEADFLRKVSIQILNSRKILKTSTHGMPIIYS